MLFWMDEIVEGNTLIGVEDVGGLGAMEKKQNGDDKEERKKTVLKP